MMTMSKILVTGGAGFIGSHTVIELDAAGFTPIILDDFSNSLESVIDGIEKIINKPVKVHRVDCTDLVALRAVFEEEGRFEAAIHFAAFKAVGESVEHPTKYYHNNVGSLSALITVMQEHDVSNLVFSSSCTVYGEPSSLPVTEEFPLQPSSSPYGYTKQVCEQLLRDLGQSGKPFKSVLLRYFNPIGAHQSAHIGELPLGVPNNLIPYITQTAAGLREKVVVFGDDYNTPDGTCIRDYIHVLDLARAHVMAIQYMQTMEQSIDAINLGTGKGHSVLDVIKSFERVSDLSLNYEIGPRRAGDVEKIYASADKAKQKLGWETRFSLDDALADAWKWQTKQDTPAWTK